jgi:hypothetical protein
MCGKDMSVLGLTDTLDGGADGSPGGLLRVPGAEVGDRHVGAGAHVHAGLDCGVNYGRHCEKLCQ